jgi:heme/copper-type cytochrome/quinol oxidase subunit 1
MHNLGLNGMMRRIADPLLYDHLRSQQPINVFVSVSAFALGLSTIPFLINFFYSTSKDRKLRKIRGGRLRLNGQFLRLPGMVISKQLRPYTTAIRV